MNIILKQVVALGSSMLANIIMVTPSS